MNVAELIADQLFKSGVRYVFGVPGGPSIPYIEALRIAGIEFILTSNETSAGIMADVTARLTGIPGICHSTYGPGATNIATGTGGAYLDRSPVLVFTSELGNRMLFRTTQMNIDHQKLFAPLTKSTFRLTPENAVEVLGKSFRICREEYPGPVHIGLPDDIAFCETGQGELYEGEITFPVETEVPGQQNTEDLISLLLNSRRPLIAAGLTAKRLNISSLLLDFLKVYNIPVVITPMAKGLIPEDHPSYAGVLFHALSDYLESLYEETDLVIGIGYDPVEFNYESWIPGVPLIHFSTGKTDMPENINVLQFAGKPDEWFNILGNLNAGYIAPVQTKIKSIREEMLSFLDSFTVHFGPVTALKILREELPPEAIITVDVGSHLHLAGQLWNTGGYGNFIISNGWSGMGFAIPAAIAAAVARPGLKCVCITGDGGFLMTAGEIMTARRYNLPVIIVVFSDGELNLIRLKQSWKDVTPCGTKIYDGDLFGSHKFLGIRVLKADSHESLTTSVNTALELSEPVIINVIIDPDDYKWLVVRR